MIRCFATLQHLISRNSYPQLLTQQEIPNNISIHLSWHISWYGMLAQTMEAPGFLDTRAAMHLQCTATSNQHTPKQHHERLLCIQMPYEL